MFILKKPWNFSSSSILRYKWLNIPKCGLFVFIRCTMFHLLQCHLLLHIIVCKTNMLKFSIALIVHSSNSIKNPLELFQTWLDSTWSVWTPRDSRVWLDWIGLNSTLLVCTHPNSILKLPCCLNLSRDTLTGLCEIIAILLFHFHQRSLSNSS
jgi:hypothetical protein